ncbi:tetratricopeptide repeat protein [Terriglobus albidus]|uniref:tetratricopeptide repeat protein n=1 Tax=Terriglobus albidus TaxID=1592106 RepID=UPI0021DF5312|nr:tetratricopeptide repeat protein [Terriglobus albidus]
MKTPDVSYPLHADRPSPFLCAFVIVSVLLSFMVKVQAQRASARSIALRQQIANAEEQHASEGQIGALWLRLANEYQSQLDLGSAEEAFTRAIPLLRSPDSHRDLADALDGLGSVYLSTGRTQESRTLLRKSLLLNRELHDGPQEAHLHEAIAIGLLLERHYRDAEQEASETLSELQGQQSTDSSEKEAALLTRSYARTYQGRCPGALQDIQQARTLVSTSLKANSLEAATFWAAQSFSLWKCGVHDGAEEAVLKALEIVNSHTDLPRPLLLSYRLSVLQQYLAYLKDTHRKPEAARVEADIRQIQEEMPPVCSNCAVSTAALSMAMLP